MISITTCFVGSKYGRRNISLHRTPVVLLHSRRISWEEFNQVNADLLWTSQFLVGHDLRSRLDISECWRRHKEQKEAAWWLKLPAIFFDAGISATRARIAARTVCTVDVGVPELFKSNPRSQ